MQEQIIVAVFPSQTVLMKALDYLLEEAAGDVRRAAVVAKSRTGEILILDDSLGEGEGGIIGGVVGAGLMSLGFAALGAMALPAMNALLVTGMGVVIGGLIGWFIGQVVARYTRFGFARNTIDTLATHLKDGHPALMLQARDVQQLLPRLRDNLQQAELIDTLLNVGQPSDKA
jgi:hypothetical protein